MNIKKISIVSLLFLYNFFSYTMETKERPVKIQNPLNINNRENSLHHRRVTEIRKRDSSDNLKENFIFELHPQHPNFTKK
ncbi:MAG: hypothetical protein WDZ41_00015 [Candidatus Babeliales bacterium]